MSPPYKSFHIIQDSITLVINWRDINKILLPTRSEKKKKKLLELTQITAKATKTENSTTR